jgi:hypothetical protein
MPDTAPESLCPHCGRMTPTILGDCPQCGKTKHGPPRFPIAPSRSGAFWGDLDDAFVWALVVVPVVILGALAVVWIGVEALFAAALLAIVLAGWYAISSW